MSRPGDDATAERGERKKSSPGKEVRLEPFVRRVGIVCEGPTAGASPAERHEGKRSRMGTVGWQSPRHGTSNVSDDSRLSICGRRE